jgi:hypothetical protein
MKHALCAILLLSGVLMAAPAARAIDPAGWVRQGIMKLDSKAEELARTRQTGKGVSSGRHRSTVKRIKRYLKAEQGKR